MLDTNLNKTYVYMYIYFGMFMVLTNCFCTFSNKPLAPHVRVWDSVSLNTLHVIGSGVFDRAATCVAFSKSVC